MSDSHENQGEGHGHDKSFEIVVNGRKKTVTKKELSFADVVALADGLPTGENILYSITYRKAEGKKEEGVLAEGGTVKIKDGTIFNVTATDKS